MLRNDFVSRPTHSAHLPSRAPSRGTLENASMSKNTSVPLYQHVLVSKCDGEVRRREASGTHVAQWPFASRQQHPVSAPSNHHRTSGFDCKSMSERTSTPTTLIKR